MKKTILISIFFVVAGLFNVALAQELYYPCDMFTIDGPLTVGTRDIDSDVGSYSATIGDTNTASGIGGFAQGQNTTASGDYSHAGGKNAVSSHELSYTWSGQATKENKYESHGIGTFNVDSTGNVDGFYIGENPLSVYMDENFRKVERDVTIAEVNTSIVHVDFNDFNEQYFAKPENEIDTTVKLFIPAATKDKTSKLIVYVEEVPSAGFHYDFDVQTIATFRTFANVDKLWLTSGNDSVWKFEFKSIPGTQMWFCDTFTEYPLSELVDPTVHSYTRAIYPDSITDYEISGVLGQNIIEKNNLVAVEIGSDVTSIVADVFESCTSLASVTIPGSVTSIGSNTFIGCSGLTNVTIGNGVTEIGEGAFDGCGLTSVVIPDSVTNIENWAFWNCSGLTNISVAAGNPQYSSANGLLLNKDGTTVLMGVNGDVTIPDSVTSIGRDAFSGCRSLASVTIPGSVTSIENYAFYDCGGLTSITIPDSVTYIGMDAFSECKNLMNVVIGNGVTSIEYYTFSGCSGLTEVTIPDSVTSIGIYAFEGCTALTNMTIPNSVTWIGGDAFENCSGLQSVTIPNSVTGIGARAFYGCSSLKIVYCTPGSESTTKELMRNKGVNVDALDFLPIPE